MAVGWIGTGPRFDLPAQTTAPEPDLSGMEARVPHVDGRPACRVAPEIIQLRVWEVMEKRLTLKISCDNCFHETTWTEGYMVKKLRKWKGQTVFRMALSLRCGGCRSNYVRVWKG